MTNEENPYHHSKASRKGGCEDGHESYAGVMREFCRITELRVRSWPEVRERKWLTGGLQPELAELEESYRFNAELAQLAEFYRNPWEYNRNP